MGKVFKFFCFSETMTKYQFKHENRCVYKTTKFDGRFSAIGFSEVLEVFSEVFMSFQKFSGTVEG